MAQHQIEAALRAVANCDGLAGRQMGVTAVLSGKAGARPAPKPAPKSILEPQAGKTIDLGSVTLRPWGG